MHNNEYQWRLEKVRTGMRSTGVDALLLMRPTNVWYVSGFWEFIPIRMEAVVVPENGDCVFLVSKNEYQYAREVSWITDIRYYTEFPETGRPDDPFALIEELLREKQLGKARIGVEGDFIPLADYEKLSSMVSGGVLVDAQEILRRARMTKSSYEIDLLRNAGRVATAAWAAAWDATRIGIREYELGLAAREAATETAARYFSESEDRHHSPITDGVQLVQTGPRSAISHGRGSMNPLREGDMVAMCFCMTNQFKAYRVGFSRNFVVGRPDQEMEAVYRLLYKAQQEALAEVRPGISASELDELVRRRIEGAGYGRYIEHRLGRGVGLDIAEAPDLKEGDNTILKPGMTLSIEPAIYIPGKWGIQIEDSVHVTSNGWEYLTEPAPSQLPVA